MDKNDLIKNICLNLASNKNEAHRIISEEYPFKLIQYESRSKTIIQRTKVFIRDGFIDRYSGNRLVFTPVLRILSNDFPEEFPYQKNWDMKKCHIAYWELSPTLDHVVPIARGGSNDDSNIVCTSMLRNSVKSNFTLDEVGWKLHLPGNINEWDGMIYWYIDYIKSNNDLLKQPYFSAWYKAIIKCLQF